MMMRVAVKSIKGNDDSVGNKDAGNDDSGDDSCGGCGDDCNNGN